MDPVLIGTIMGYAVQLIGAAEQYGPEISKLVESVFNIATDATPITPAQQLQVDIAMEAINNVLQDQISQSVVGATS